MVKKMKNLLYFLALPFLIFISSAFFWGCDAAEEFAEEQMYIADTTIIKIDTIRTRTEIKFVPVKFELIVQIASFARKQYADIMSLKADSILNKKTDIIFEDNYYIVAAGRFTDPEKANAYMGYVKGKGFSDAFVKKIKRLDSN
jgi:hypothetical protein